MTCENVVAPTTRGSDFAFRIGFRNVDEAGVRTPKDIIGYAPTFLDLDTTLVDRLTPTIPDPTTGDVIVTGEGSPPLTVGQHKFRLLLTGPSDHQLASPLLVILVS